MGRLKWITFEVGDSVYQEPPIDCETMHNGAGSKQKRRTA